jgi:hypothetical protein
MDLDTIQNQINELQKQVNMLKSVANIPRDVEEAFRERLQIPTINNAPAITQATLERDIVLTGDPQTIKVLKYPDEWISVTTTARQVKRIPVYTP